MKSKIIIFSLVFIGLFLFTHRSFAAPQITGVSGTISDGSSISITGSSFGFSGPTIQVFDDFELGTNGSVIPVGGGSQARIGKWDYSDANGNTAPLYSNAYKVSGSLAMRNNFDGYWLSNLVSRINGGTSDAFVSYNFYLPTASAFPGYANPDGENWKIFWLWGTGSTNADAILPQSLGQNNHIIPDCNDCYTTAPDKCITYVPAWSMAKGQWYRIYGWIHARANTSGSFYAYALPLGASTRVSLNEDSACRHWNNAGDVFLQACAGCYGRSPLSGSATTYMDDIYVATGVNCQTRVEIGNAPTYAACTNLAVTTPTSWSNSQITTTVRRGSFQSGQTAYLYVFDASGAVNASGYPITIGSGATTPPPPITKKGDINADGKVDIVDLGIFLSNWNATAKPASDINQDSKVDIVDLGILLSNWG